MHPVLSPHNFRSLATCAIDSVSTLLFSLFCCSSHLTLTCVPTFAKLPAPVCQGSLLLKTSIPAMRILQGAAECFEDIMNTYIHRNWPRFLKTLQNRGFFQIHIHCSPLKVSWASSISAFLEGTAWLVLLVTVSWKKLHLPSSSA